MRQTLVSLLLLVALGGCTAPDETPFGTVESFGPCRPDVGFVRLAVDVTRPLALGAHVITSSERSVGSPAVLETVTIASSDPNVLSVDATDPYRVEITAVGFGTADVVITEASGSARVGASYRVLPVTSFDTYSMLALVAGEADADALVEVPSVVVGSTARFVVVARNGTEQLQFLDSGFEAFAAPPGGVPRSWWLPPEAIVELKAEGLGVHTVRARFVPDLLVRELPFEVDVTVRGVDASSIATLELRTEGDAGKADGRCVTMAAVPRDGSGAIVHGAGTGFLEVEPNTPLGHGDAVAYSVRYVSHTRLRAHAGGRYAEIPIHAGDVSIARIAGDGSCAVSRGPGPSPWLALATLAIAWRRRRSIASRA